MIRINDKFEIEWEEGMTVTRLLERLQFSFPLIIVSVNGVLVPKTEFTTRQIPDGAKVRVLHMTAGG